MNDTIITSLYKRGVSLANEKKYEEALNFFEYLLKKYKLSKKEKKKALLSKAVILSNMEKYKESLNILDNLIKEDIEDETLKKKIIDMERLIRLYTLVYQK